MESTVWSQNPRGGKKRIHAEEKRGSHQAEGISEQKIISLRNWGHVLTPFVGTCHSVGKAADEEWVGAGSKKKREHIGPFGPEEASQPMRLWKELADGVVERLWKEHVIF